MVKKRIFNIVVFRTLILLVVFLSISILTVTIIDLVGNSFNKYMVIAITSVIIIFSIILGFTSIQKIKELFGVVK